MTFSVGKIMLSKVVLIFIVTTILFAFLPFVQSGAGLTYVLIAFVLFSIALLVFCKKNVDLFEPLTWLLIMSSLFYIFSIIICFLDFGFLYHDNFSTRDDRFEFLFYAVALFTLGLMFFILGDFVADSFCFKFNSAPGFRLYLNKDLSLLLGGGLIALGGLNFAVNSYAYNSTDLLMLLKDFGARNHRIQDGVFYSTLGYNFLISGLFFLMYRRVFFFKSLGVLYKCIFVASLVVLLSTGRIWYTVSLVFVFLGLAHFSGMQVKLRSMMIYCVALCFAVLSIYFIRLYSNLSYINSEDAFGSNLISDFSSKVVEFIFGRSNVPSVPILMEVIDLFSGGQDFYAGKTLFYWLSYFIPGYDVTFLGHEIKERLYPGRPGGFPPTVFGEFYANGGVFFVVLASLYLGFISKLFYVYTIQVKSFLLYFIYSAILFRFIFMLPKLEMSALGSAVWLFLPTVLLCVLLRLLVLGCSGKANA
ncbi:O-antigen polymerase [Stutzerimonas frequens]|uniref:O-antigen polymerase n=1 Tax=Stutzerimonas frequens TaxID=2968969 RepID=UPI0013A6123A|nr:O-antigen polymerase [Stutzerimonas frequens]